MRLHKFTEPRVISETVMRSKRSWTKKQVSAELDCRRTRVSVSCLKPGLRASVKGSSCRLSLSHLIGCLLVLLDVWLFLPHVLDYRIREGFRTT